MQLFGRTAGPGYPESHERSGYQVIVADNGWDALNLVVDASPDLVLLDLMMPKLDGFGFLDALKSSAAAGTPVIVTSALADSTRREQAFNLGAKDYLVKTKFSLGDLISTIQRNIPPHAAAAHA